MGAEDFLSNTNVAGQTLLKLVSRGNAIIAEILRLSDFVPAEFRFLTKEDQRKYGEIILDFNYFRTQEFCDQRVENNAELLERDEEFRENNLPILNRFYLMFESIYKYVKDLIRYLTDLDEGVFIQQTLESVFSTSDGKQLLIEALFLYGVMLLILDQKIDGLVRERLLVSYYRYKGEAASSTNIDEVCKLCRQTGFTLGSVKKPDAYPENFFSRIPLPKQYIMMSISRLRSDDIYNQIPSYPNPDHRSTALATQASMLYVILYFAPDLLMNDPAKMREIVDKHFPDNWVIAYYLGFVVDLSQAWEYYKAAKSALLNSIAIPNIQNFQSRYVSSISDLNKQLQQFLTEGVLTESYVLDSIPKLMNCLRECNVTIRWLMLHTNAKVKKFKDIICQGFSEVALMELLLNTSTFEFTLKNIFSEALKKKSANWDNYKKEATDRMIELAEYFSGEKALTRVTKNENLQNWFNDIARQISSLDYSSSTVAGRKIVQLIQALEEVQEFHQLESNLQVRAFLADTRGFLHQMIRTVNVKEEILVTIQLVADLSYAWDIINKYIPLMQTIIKKTPSSVIKLRSTFLKLASILDLPLVRIVQAGSNDVKSVAEYYSGELVEFVRRVLQIIPASMFEVLNEIVNIQTNRLLDLPTRLEKEKYKDFSQLQERYELARRTHSISVYTEGMLAMETTLVGVIKVDPKQLLEDGIRRELVLQVATAMDKTLVFSKSKPGDLENKLKLLSLKLDAFRRSFEYIQDYVNIYALKIWQEELSRIINYNVEKECNSFLKEKVQEWDSVYQSTAIPIPNFPPADDSSVGFIGRLGREVIDLSDIKKTTFVLPMSAWYDRKTNQELVSLKTFSTLFESVGTFGLTGLDRLYSFMIVRLLQRVTDTYRKNMKAEKGLKQFLEQTFDALEPTSSLPQNSAKLYQNSCSKIANMTKNFTELISKIGQLQLLRKSISNELCFRAKLDSNNLFNSLLELNNSLLNDVERHYKDDEKHPYPKDDNPLLFELATYLECSGLYNPALKIYITTKQLELLPLVMFLYVVAQLPKFERDPVSGAFVYKGKSEPLDGTPFIAGIATLLKQFHSSHTKTFLAYICQYIRTFVNATGAREPKPLAFPVEVINGVIFLQEYCKYSNTSRKVVESFLPSYLMNSVGRLFDDKK